LVNGVFKKVININQSINILWVTKFGLAWDPLVMDGQFNLIYAIGFFCVTKFDFGHLKCIKPHFIHFGWNPNHSCQR
jgi:hypothetical protein